MADPRWSHSRLRGSRWFGRITLALGLLRSQGLVPKRQIGLVAPVCERVSQLDVWVCQTSRAAINRQTHMEHKDQQLHRRQREGLGQPEANSGQHCYC